MQKLVNLCKRISPAALLVLALLLALPIPAGADEEVFASIRIYEGVDPADQAEIARLTAEGFLPINRESEGFVGYYLLPAGDILASINLFESPEQAAASNEKARDFVTENLAPFLPNAPMIVEGVVEVSTVADAAAMMGDEGLSPSHALLAIYDGFDMARLDDTVTLVESVFLPELREDGGLFSYHGISDGVDKAVALRVMDSAESLQRGSDIAADFIAEHMDGWLPPDPLQVTGQLAVAALGAIDEGANLVKDEPSDSVFVSIRHYAGLDPVGQDELYRLTAEGFLPIIRDSEGYIGYYWLHEGENVMAVSLFESQEQASASAESAREYVAENLAHLVAGPPRTVEGQVDIGFVELLDGIGDGEVSSLHASVRIYDGFEADDLDEFVAIVEDGFLPIMRETDGFFGYYLMNDGAGTLSAISIFDSEASSLTSNENAREFVAENLTAYLPSVPSIVSGRVGIASHAGLNDGANLIDDEPVYVSIRVYDGVDPTKREEIVRLVDPEFLSIMRESDGFLAYYLLPAGDKLASISLFDSAEQAAASNEKARDYVAEFMAPLLPNAPTVVEGHIDVMYVNDAGDMMLDDGMAELYASLRIYQVSDMGGLEESVESVKAYLLPALHEAGGLVSYYALNDGDDTIAGLNVYASEEKALAANDIAAAFNAEHATDFLPDQPLRVNGQLGVAALAGIHMGENLVGAAEADERAFVSIRVFDGVNPADMDAIVHHASTGFLPIINTHDDFIAYFQLPAGDTAVAVNIFASAEGASASNAAAADYVTEHMASLLPNPPHIFEGTIDLFYMALLDQMMALDADDVSSLYGALRMYDNVDLTDRAHDVELVESIFLPIQQKAAGFFGYVNMNNGESSTAALSIFDSEENAHAANAAAADFIAEHFSDTHPESPLRVTGLLGVAALGEIDQGANLVDAEPVDGVFASVRVYDGIEPGDQGEIARVTNEGFLPIMRESDGFVGYYFVTAVDKLATVSLFDSPEQASASADKAREYVAENLAPLLPNAPTIYEGELAINQVAALGDGGLFASIRFYGGFDLSYFDQANDLAIAHLLPALQDLGGLFAQYALNDGVDTVVGISIFTSEEAALAANEVGKVFTRDYLADWAPNPPSGVSGKLAIAALAEINMGENLVGAVME